MRRRRPVNFQDTPSRGRSGGLDADTRFNAERLAAQSRVAAFYGPAPLQSHPASAGREMRDMLRQFMNLDAMN